MSRILGKEKFIERAVLIHNKKYNYSLVNYVNNYTKIQIICNIHGLFQQRPDHHLDGHGCAKCGDCAKLSLLEFTDKANKIHNHIYDYSSTNYINAKTKIKIICKIHGAFWQTPHGHLLGKGCLECGIIKRSDNLLIFLTKAKAIHKDKYDYSLTEYIHNRFKIKIICKIHGTFQQTPNSHLRGNGCSLCSFKNETIINDFLIQNNINYVKQYPIISNGVKRIDFYIKDYNLFIEYNGNQHYYPVRFNNISLELAQRKFEKQQIRDQLVRQYCLLNKINLLEIDGRKYYGKTLSKYLENEFINNLKLFCILY